MTKICTTIEQSKKLIELGIPKNTADMRIGNYVGKSGKVDGTNVHYYTKEESFGAPEIIPAWSLSALVDLMPKNVEIERTHIGWRCDYYSNNDSLLKYGKDKNTLFDAVFEMVVWLKESGKI